MSYRKLLNWIKMKIVGEKTPAWEEMRGLTVEKLLYMTREEIGQLNLKAYPPVEVLCMCLDEIRKLRRALNEKS